MAKSLKEIFTEAQFHTHTHDAFAKQLLNQFKAAKTDQDVFCDQFIHCLKYVLIEYKPEPTVERLVKFVSKVVAMAGNEEALQRLFESVINFLLQSYEANDKAVRYRTCQLMAQIIDLLGDAELDDEICDQIFKAMHSRLSDKVFSVRVHAIKALSRLQDPSEKGCPIIKAFLFLMNSDPNWQVRVECLRCVAPTKRSLGPIMERTRDVNEVIRRTAYHVIAEKISVKALSISHRLSLLQNGLSDRSAHVQKACTDKLLQAWLVHYQGDILELLSGLDIMSSSEICENAVNLIISKSSTEQILDGFDLLTDERLIDRERLSCESVFYYRVLLEYVSKLGEASSELLEKILPEAKTFIDYIKQVTSPLSVSETEFEERATVEYLLQQLLLCIKYIDVSDPISRRSVLSLCKDLLSSDHISITLVPQLVECLQGVLKSPHERMDEVAGIISDIQVPIVTEEQEIDPETLHQLKYKLAGVNMNLNELADMLTEAVGKQDFATAAEIKEKIGILETSKQALTEEMIPKPVAVASQARNDEATTLKCLTIFVELMTSGDMSVMTDTVRSYMEELVIPAIPDTCPAVRNQAVKALGLCSLCDQEVARKFLPVFLQICQMDEEAIRISSLRALFDIVLVHGMDCLSVAKTDSHQDGEGGSASLDGAPDSEDKENRAEPVIKEEEEDVFSLAKSVTEEIGDESSLDSQTAYRSANDLIQMMVDCLEDESSGVRTLCAEGLAKLMLTAKVISSKLLSRLIILWYNPITEDDVKLRHCLGVFLPVYAFANRENQAQVEQAFLPTLQVIFDAPNSSPLSDIDEHNVAVLLVQLTDHKSVKPPADGSAAGSTTETTTSHDSLAIKICNEILERGNGYGVLTLSKILNLLDLSLENELLAKDLRNLSAQLVRVVKDKGALKHLDKFNASLGESTNQTELEETPQTADADADDDAGDEEAADEEIDSTVLDTTAVTTSRLKRAVVNRSRINSTLADITDTNTEDSDESEKSSARGRRKTKAPKLEVSLDF